MARFMGWIGGSRTMRYLAHAHTREMIASMVSSGVRQSPPQCIN
ncbi:hypothetical protein Pla52o_38570 [Novipirellula galeiformis]|uniref:Uncharacterized protein n=1 Tax=Novipirellula galeiformis TaxID=2528004 RepID=A0A5C6CAQ3_9BACT|nr:hypothetical protein Pla52o_38570 [Novipirellula galeiformis]